jgi:twitching motility two-component system response regulator PilH
VSEKILIIEDNTRVAEVLSQIFQILGYTTHVAHDGEEGSQAFASFQPDLVLTDVVMPKKNGYQVCRDIKADPRTSGTPVILLTARNLKEDVAWGYDCGADAYICKPYEPKILEETVARLIRERRDGSHSLSWTGLPSAEFVYAELVKREGAAEPVALFEASFGEQSSEVYCMKYGSAQYRELILSCSQLLPRLLKTRSPESICGQDGTNTFLVLLPAKDAPAVRSAITSVFNATAAAFYERGDLIQGFIAYSNPETGQKERIPQMKLEVREHYPSCEAERNLRSVPPMPELVSIG